LSEAKHLWTVFSHGKTMIRDSSPATAGSE
jgi:hypothetical protein